MVINHLISDEKLHNLKVSGVRVTTCTTIASATSLTSMKTKQSCPPNPSYAFFIRDRSSKMRRLGT